MKKILFTALSCTLCFSLMIGCTKSSDDEKEVNYITMESFNENDEGNTTEEGLVATIYTADEEALNLIDKKVNVESITADTILEKLITCNVIPEDTKVISFKTYTSNDNLEVGVLDFSEEFYNFNLGSGFESMMLDSVAKTYIENFELDKLKILVDGMEYQSGHILFEEEDFFTLEDLK